MDTFAPLWFCVKVLVDDGLLVPPFDMHPEGDGRLRSLGLTAEVWLEWVANVLRQDVEMSQLGQELFHGGGPTEEAMERGRAASRVLTRPGLFCPGSDQLREELNDLFVPLYQTAESWRMQAVSDRLGLHGAGTSRATWRGLEPYQDKLRNFKVYLVEYPAPAAMTLPPSTAVIAPAANGYGFDEQVTEAGKALAATADIGPSATASKGRFGFSAALPTGGPQVEALLRHVERAKMLQGAGDSRLERVVAIGAVADGGTIRVELLALVVRERMASILWRAVSSSRRMFGMPEIEIADGLGTRYEIEPGSWHGSDHDSEGEIRFVPRPPPDASSLQVIFHAFSGSFEPPWVRGDTPRVDDPEGPWRFTVSLRS